MGKNFTYFLALLGALNLCFAKANAQTVELNHTPMTVAVNNGDTVTLSVAVKNFTNVFGLQGTISWNSSKLEFLDTPNTNLAGMTPANCGGALCSFTTTFVNDGDLLLQWFNAGGITLADDTEIYDIRFKAIATGLDTVAFTDDRLQFLATQDDGMGGIGDVTPNTQNSHITINSIPGSGSPCDQFTEFGIYLSSDTIQTGEQTCLDVNVCGFNNIVGFGYTQQFNPNLLQFDSVANLIPQLSGAAFGATNISQGFLNLSWIDTTALTLPDETTIYQLCFTASGAGGTMDTVLINSSQTDFDAVDDNQNELTVGSSPGYVSITGTAQAAVQFFASDEILEIPGDTCVDVRVRNFEDMLSFAYTMEWDTSIIVFDTIIDPNDFFDGDIAGSINSNPSLVDTGALTVNWLSPGLGTTPVTVADSTLIYQICFTGAGDSGEISPVEFTSSQIQEIAIKDDGSGGQVIIPMTTSDGSVEILSLEDFVFRLSDHEVCPGDTFTVDFIAQGWNQILNMSFLLNWDTLDLEWVGLHDNILPPLFGANTTPQFTDEGKISVFFFEQGLAGVTYPDGTVLFQMDFKAIGTEGNSTEIIFTEDPEPTGTKLTAGDVNGSIPFSLDDSQIDFVCSTGPTPTLSSVITSPDCFGDATGAIDVTVVNGTDPMTFNWDGPGSFTAATEDISGLEAGTYNLTFTDGGGTIIMDAFVVTQPDSLILSTTSVNSSCAGISNGSIDLTVSGGTTDYSYSWDNGLPSTEDQTGLAAGTYCVTVTDDNGCTANICETVGEDSPPTISTTSTDASCNGGADGTIDVTVNGGTPDYTFAWDNSLPSTEDQTGLTVGTYCVTVTDDNGCTANTCVTIVEANAPTLSSTHVDATCGGSDGSIDLTVNGGAPTIMFSWDNGLPSTEDQTGLAGGTYCVTVTDGNSCAATTCITIDGNEPPTISVSSTDETCGDSNGSIDLTINGGAPDYTFSWDNGLDPNEDQTGLDGGTYCVTVTDDNGCTADTCITIDDIAGPTLSETSTDASCGGSDGTIDITVNGGTSDFTFNWDNGLDPNEDQSGLTAGTYCVTVTDANNCTADICVVISEDGAPTISATSTDEFCDASDGTIDITVNGGTPDYTFNWDNGLDPNEDQTGLEAGTYCVTVTDDNGCTAETCVTIMDFGSPTLTATQTDATCGGSDGTIDLTVNGGTPDFTFSWDNGLDPNEDQTGLSAGTYCVTVTDDNNCTAATCITIDEIGGPTISFEAGNVSCNGADNGSIDLVVSGGTPDYTFAWSDGLPDTEDQTGLAPGSYSVTVTDDNGCTATRTIDITEPDAISITETHSDVDCNGDGNGSIDLTITGGTPDYTFEWSGGLPDDEDQTGLDGGTYDVTVTDVRGCTETLSITIEEPDVLMLSGSVTDDSGLGDGMIDITVTGGTPDYTYDWNGLPNTEDQSGLSPGTYSVTVTDMNGCTVEDDFEVNGPGAPSIVEFDITDAGCSGTATGAIDITVQGGVPNLMFDWSGPGGFTANTEDISNIASGNYSVTIIDGANNMVTGGPYAVGQATTITFTETHTNTTCSYLDDGSISLTISGGNDPYTVEWNGGLSGPSLSDLAAGNYTPTITDDDGCEEIGATITIEAAPELEINVVEVVDVVCFGEFTGSIQIEVNGGTGAPSIVWDPTGLGLSLANISAGEYTPTVTDANGCVLEGDEIEVQEPNSQIRANENITPISCAGAEDGDIRISASGGNGDPYQINWDPDLTVGGDDDLFDIGPGAYALTITDAAGCSETFGPFTMPEPDPITAQAFIDNASSSNDDGRITLVVSGGSGDYDFDWVGNTGTYPNDNVITGLASGAYDVTISDAANDDCFITATYFVQGTIGVNYTVNDVSCNGENDGSIIQTSISGGVGGYTYEWNTNPTRFTPDLTDVGPGIYMVTVADANGMVTIQSYEVQEPIALEIQVTNVIHETGLGCNGSISINVENGKEPYTYNWSNGEHSQTIVDLCKGDYSVEVIDDNGCIVTSDIITINPAPLGVSNVEIISGACFNESNGEFCLEYFGGCGPYMISLDGGSSFVDLDGEVCFPNLTGGLHTFLITDNFGLSLTETINIPQYTEIVGTAMITNNSAPAGSDCNGAINLTVTGGMPLYQFQWSHGPMSEDVDGLCADLSPYSVIIEDENGCTTTVENLVVENGITVVADIMDLCDPQNCDGEIFIEPSGGVSPYSFAWSNNTFNQDLIGVCAGEYTVTITDDEGKVSTHTYNISAPGNPLTVIGLVTDATTGMNGSIDLTATGGYGNYSYLWETGQETADIAGLAPGTYVVTVTDNNGCQNVSSYDIFGTEDNVMFVRDEPSCFGDEDGCLEAIVSGNSVAPYTYIWSNGLGGQKICGIGAGEYSVTITDALGTVIPSLPVTLGQPDELQVTATEQGENAAEAIVQGGNPPYNYNWNDLDNTQDAIVTDLEPGNYTVLVTDDKGCIAMDEYQFFPEGDCSETRNIITPNGDGENDEFLILCAYTFLDNELLIFDRWGQLVYRTVGYDNTWTGFDQSNTALPEGGYFYIFEYRDPVDGVLNQEKGHITIVKK